MIESIINGWLLITLFIISIVFWAMVGVVIYDKIMYWMSPTYKAEHDEAFKEWEKKQ
jgi:hypothetical protein